MKSITRDINGVHSTVEYYTGIQDFLSTQDAREYTYHASQYRTDYDIDFQGVSTYEEAVDLFEHGYSQEIEALNLPPAKNGARRPAFTASPIGFAPIVPNALKGLPNSMIDTRPRKSGARVVRLVVDVGRSGSVETYEIEEWGRQIVALCRGLEIGGQRVQIDVLASCSTYRGTICAFRLPIKRAQEPLDIKRICFPIVHPAFQRVFKFDWYDRMPNSPTVGGYGHALCYEDSATRAKYAEGILQPNEYYVGYTTDFDELKNEITQGAR